VRFTGTRAERWRVDLLDYQDGYKRELREFLGGTYEVNGNRPIIGSGSISVAFHIEDDDVEWGRDRFQVWYSPGYVDGEREWWPRGVFLPSLPEIEYDDETGLLAGSVKVMDKLLILDQDSPTGPHAVPAGASVVEEVNDLIASAGETRVNVEPSGEVLASPITWDAGTSKLQIINDLLRTIGYTPLRATGSGQFEATKQKPVRDRGVAWEFAQGRDSLHIPRWVKNDDWADTPNRVVLISQGDEETEAMMAVEEHPPESRFSYEARGQRWIVHTETDVQVTSQAVLDDLARMRLGGLARSYSNMSVEHAMLDLWPGDRVDFRTDVYRTAAEIHSFTVAMEPGALVQGTWREVTDA